MYSPRVPGRLYQPFAGLSSSLSRALLRGEELSGRVLRLSVGEEDRAVERRGDRESERVRLGGPVGWSGGVLLVQACGERVSASIAVDRVLASNAGTPHHHFAHHHSPHPHQAPFCSRSHVTRRQCDREGTGCVFCWREESVGSDLWRKEMVFYRAASCGDWFCKDGFPRAFAYSGGRRGIDDLCDSRSWRVCVRSRVVWSNRGPTNGISSCPRCEILGSLEGWLDTLSDREIYA